MLNIISFRSFFLLKLALSSKTLNNVSYVSLSLRVKGNIWKYVWFTDAIQVLLVNCQLSLTKLRAKLADSK